MWTPTHVQVTVHKAKNLKVKGRSGENDSYVVIQLNDSKFRTSVKTRDKIPDWNENCDIPIQGDLAKSVVRLTVHHRNFLTTDDFLGGANIFLKHLPLYERPKRKWYSLVNRTWPNMAENKEEKELREKRSHGENEELGELQVTVAFMMKSRTIASHPPSSPDSSNKSGYFQRQKSLSFRSLASQVGVALPSRWGSQSDLKDSPLTDLTERKFPMHSMLEMYNASRSFYDLSLSVSEDDIWISVDDHDKASSEDDVISPSLSEDHKVADFEKELSQNNRDNINSQGSQTLLRIPFDEDKSGLGVELRRRSPARPRSLHTLDEENQVARQNEAMDHMNNARNTFSIPTLINTPSTPTYSNNYIRAAHKRHSYIGCGETPPLVAAYRLSEIEDFMENLRLRQSSAPSNQSSPHLLGEIQKDRHDHFEGYDREDLINLVLEQQSWIQLKRAYVRDLEDYVDKLLVRVLDTNHQSLLENPYQNRPTYPVEKISQQPKKTDGLNVKIKEKFKNQHIFDLYKIWK